MESACRLAVGDRCGAAVSRSDLIRFGPFALDPDAYTLTRAGRAVHLERIPMDLLILLAREQGRLVSREAIIERLWGAQAFIDVDNAINTAIRKIRRTLGDSPGQPAYLETVVGKGYRLRTDGRRPGDSALPAATPARPMLLVLPFENLTGRADQEYFSDGLTEETIARLAQLSPSQLGVIARTTAMAYRGTDKTVARIGAELGVDYVLEGSVRRDGDRVRVTVQLIRVADQSHLWAQGYDREAGRVVEIQGEIGAAIARQVQLRLPLRAASALPAHAGAHDDYLRGLYHQAKVTHAELIKAIACFRRAVERDDTYVAAYTGLAHSYIRLPIACDVPAQQAFPAARLAIERALALDPDSAEAHTADAATRFWFDWDFAGARRVAQRALALNGNYAPAHLALAHVCSNVGDHDAALAAIRNALALDPLSLLAHAMHGQFLYQAGRDTEALACLQATLELEPRFWIAHICLAKVCARLGRHAEALAACERAHAGSGGNAEAASIAGYVHAAAGDRTLALRTLEDLMERAGRGYVPPYDVALVHAGLGDGESALAWLERAYADRDVHLVFLRDAKWDGLRTLPAFRGLQRRVGLPE